ncbi:MAG: alcohol dehydrogenase catalytic domain-containing protein [Lachnospiraceae bacterium]|nr:alcohol dehydrogenase catalytic domain-containing protein [Lachnospiraceae bacterium]
MRAAFIDKPFSISFIKDAPEPQLSEGRQIKIKVHTVGICGSEMHAYHGTHPFRIPPVVTGHEFSGTVVAVGKEVSKFQIGDRVTAEVGVGCDRCSLCKAGLYNVCKTKHYLGSGNWSGPFGEYIIVPEKVLYKIPDHVSFEVGALIEPLAVGMHAVRSSKPEMGSTICVVGCGAIGLSVILAARLAGVTTIIASDVSEGSLAIAAELGATHLHNATAEPLHQKVEQLTKGLGVDICYLAFGNEHIYDEVLDLTRPGGTISQIAFMNEPFLVDVAKIQNKSLRIIGCNAYVSKDYHIVCEALKNKRFWDLEKMITKVFPIEACAKAVKMVEQRDTTVIRVMLQFR